MQRVDELKRFSLFKEPDIQDRYELDIVKHQFIKRDWHSFKTQIKDNTKRNSGLRLRG